MPSLISDCPRCGSSKITFDVEAAHDLRDAPHGWCHRFEAYSVCRACERGTIFLIRLNEYERHVAVKGREFWGQSHVLNSLFDIERFLSIRDRASHEPPEHSPASIAAAFNEGATCLSVECFNAATAMFRLCVDLATKPLLPDVAEEVEQPGKHERRNLKPRIEWLIAQGRLPRDLEGLLENLREDGNDGAHDGTLGKEDAEDAMDFAQLLLRRLYTEPRRLEIAQERRTERRELKAKLEEGRA